MQALWLVWSMCEVWEAQSEAIALQLLQEDILQVRFNMDSLSTR
jgi:hypothetical protein